MNYICIQLVYESLSHSSIQKIKLWHREDIMNFSIIQSKTRDFYMKSAC